MKILLENLGNMMDLVKKIQANVDQTQEQLKSERVESNSGDVIKIAMNGQQEVLSIELNPKYLSAENAALLQDLLVATINNTLAKSREINQQAMSKLAGDLNLPKIPGLF
ncbi:MAG: YbaB/EbfC family nucleoid-associated protein [Pelosinus sp.]|nr:YbaB/EbfC family nucleoid-associated protein [Pelosinus sp.]